MPIHFCLISRWTKGKWKVMSKTKGKKEHEAVCAEALEKYVRHEVYKKSMRIKKIHFKCTDEDTCYLALTNEDFDLEIVFLMIRKLERECSDTNKAFLKKQFAYFNNTEHETIKKALGKLENLRDELLDASDEEEKKEVEEEDELANVNIKKEMRGIEKQNRKKKPCNVM